MGAQTALDHCRGHEGQKALHHRRNLLRAAPSPMNRAEALGLRSRGERRKRTHRDHRLEVVWVQRAQGCLL